MMTIQKVAEKTGLSAYTIRFYEHSGLLPPTPRSRGGIRQFREADVTFLQFLLELKRTGMSLEEMAAFTADGCLLEQLQQGIVPEEPLERRLALLRTHEQRVLERRHHLDRLLETIAHKVAFYEQALQQQRDHPMKQHADETADA